MFDGFKKWLHPAQHAEHYVETAILTTFDALAREIHNPDRAERLTRVVSELASLIGALRDTHPELPIDDEGPAMRLIKMHGAGDVSETEKLLDAILELIRDYPDYEIAKINAVIFAIAPSFVSSAGRPAGGLLAKWETFT